MPCLVRVLALLAPLVTLLGDRKLNTTTTRHRDPALLGGARDKNVVQARRELATSRVADMHDIEATMVTLTRNDLTGTAHVTTTSDHDVSTRVELDEADHLVGSEVELDSVVHPH